MILDFFFLRTCRPNILLQWCVCVSMCMFGRVCAYFGVSMSMFGCVCMFRCCFRACKSGRFLSVILCISELFLFKEGEDNR